MHPVSFQQHFWCLSSTPHTLGPIGCDFAQTGIPTVLSKLTRSSHSTRINVCNVVASAGAVRAGEAPAGGRSHKPPEQARRPGPVQGPLRDCSCNQPSRCSRLSSSHSRLFRAMLSRLFHSIRLIYSVIHHLPTWKLDLHPPASGTTTSCASSLYRSWRRPWSGEMMRCGCVRVMCC